MVDYLTTRLFAPAGIRIADVVEEVGYSQRHVLGLFRRWVGLPPKQYGRIRRFQQVLGSAANGDGAPPPDPDWADIAADHGYYDQSHLIRDFQQFAGMSPGAYLVSYRGLENYLPFD